MKELKTHTSKKEGAKKGNGKLDTLFSRSVKKKVGVRSLTRCFELTKIVTISKKSKWEVGAGVDRIFALEKSKQWPVF